MSNEKVIEQSIVPIKAADLIGYIARRKGISLRNAMCFFYDSDLSAEAAIVQLRTHTLFDQLSFHTQAAVRLLKCVEAQEV